MLTKKHSIKIKLGWIFIILIQSLPLFAAKLIKFNSEGNKILARVAKSQTLKKGDLYQTDTGCLLEVIAQKGEKLFLKNDLCSSSEIALGQVAKRVRFNNSKSFLAANGLDKNFDFTKDLSSLDNRYYQRTPGGEFVGEDLTPEETEVLKNSEPLRLYRTHGLIFGWYSNLSFPDYRKQTIIGNQIRERELSEESSLAIGIGYRYLPVASFGFYSEAFYSYLTSKIDVFKIEVGSSYGFNKNWSLAFGINVSRIEDSELNQESFGVGAKGALQYFLTKNISFNLGYSAMNQFLISQDEMPVGIGLKGVEIGLGMSF